MTAERAHHWRHPALPGLDLLRARYVTYRFGRHVHEGYAIGLIESGVEEFEHADDVWRAGPGMIGVVNPEVVHTGQAGTPEGWSYRVLYPTPDLMAGIAAELGARPGTPFFPTPVIDDPQATALLRIAHQAGEQGDALAASSLMREGLAVLLRHARNVPDQNDNRAVPAAVRLARDILHADLLTPPTLEELAETAGTGPFRLVRAFRAAYGLPPHAYLNQVRVREARRLLDEGLRPAEVAARTGFADQAHLTRHFKRSVGVPPGAYRQARMR
ncbi:AraC family transcriptional regulator [Actinomadura hibisca]|uniref:AraC family transcriptional regulator n=1 Tax=Actinomadura hibisca TaxID=68565 RepID=UPI0027D8DC15|nr:AraC family transcriptional regulator [Actinomadura hibisca]